MSDDFEREERAFAEALHASVPVESFRPLDAETIKAAAGPARPARTGWMRTMAAAAVLVVAVGVGAALLPRMSGAASVWGEPEPPGFAAGGAAAETAQDRGSAAAQPDKANNSVGFRWESFRDVQVQVPESWGYASAPQSDYCINERLPSEPYVDLNRGGGAVAAILCSEELGDDEQAMHLSFTPITSEPPWSSGSSVWRQHSREVGEARVTVTARDADSDLVARILDSAVGVPAGSNPDGCPVELPTVPAVGLAGLDAVTLTVCLYEREEQRGAFRSSVVLTGPDATTAWQAVLGAPEGGGPDMAASTCGKAEGWPLLILVGDQRVPVAASAAGCAGNGVADASARGGMRTLTRPLCQALIVDPVRLSVGFGPSAGLCMR